MKVKTIDELKEGGYNESEISNMLDIPLMVVYSHLGGEKEYIPKVIDESELVGTEKLKEDLVNTAQFAVTQLKNGMKNADAQELAKLTDSVAKLYTALFKEDKGTQITIQQNNLSMFKGSLKR